MSLVEEVKRQLEMLRIIRERPELLKRIGELEKKVGEQDSEISSLREVERIVDGERTTLPQLRELIAMVKGEEIKVEAQRFFSEYKANWEKNQKPKDLYSEACRVLLGIMEQLRSHKRFFEAGLVKLGLPSKIAEMLNAEVKARTDAEFLKRVGMESDKKALKKLEALKKDEWPRWYATSVEPKIRELETQAKDNVFKMLMGPWTITCDKCAAQDSIELAPQTIGDLLRRGWINIECANPDCKDWGRHKIRITLQELISHYLA